jgi:hypothetical protein
VAIVTSVGRPSELTAVGDYFRNQGYVVSFHPTTDPTHTAAKDDVAVAVMALVTNSGDPVLAELVQPLVDELKDQGDVGLLFATDRQARRIEWDHHGDECVAQVGGSLKWRTSPASSGGRYGPWKYGRTVWYIEPGPPCWRVQLSILQPSDGWADFLLAGNRVKVEWFWDSGD